MDNGRMPMLGEKAPHFQANTTYGMVSFPEDYKGKWVVFFSHPGDFTPVCTTEIMTFASMVREFEVVNCALLGLSVDSNPSHIEWCRMMEKYSWNGINKPNISFHIVADDLGGIAKLYGMIMPAVSATKTVRDVFIIDPEGVIRAMLVYPLTTGRNINEILRVVMALQAFDKTGYATPAGWMPGDPQVLPAPQTLPLSVQRLDDQKKDGFACLDWYICFTQGKNLPMPAIASASAPVPTGAPIPPPTAAKAVSAATQDMTVMGAKAVLTEQAARQMAKPDPAAGMQTVKAVPRRASTVGEDSIMGQNRLLFENTVGAGVFNEYMITRDYPRPGENG